MLTLGDGTCVMLNLFPVHWALTVCVLEFSVYCSSFDVKLKTNIKLPNQRMQRMGDEYKPGC